MSFCAGHGLNPADLILDFGDPFMEQHIKSST